MSKDEKFLRDRKRRWTDFFIFYMILVFFVFSNFTLSKYSAKSEATVTLNVAQFKVKINEEDIMQTKAFDLALSPTSNTLNNKLAPDSEGYFDIEINPDGAQVSLDYEIELDLSQIENTNINLKNYTVDYTSNYSDETEKEFIDVPENNKITGDIKLPENAKTGFTTEDAITIRVYWEWNEDIVITGTTMPDITQKNIKATCVVKQKIN